MPKGLFNPKNVAPDTGGPGFKEGPVRVDASNLVIYQSPAPKTPKADYVQPLPIVALMWDVTRLDENLEPLTDEHDNPLTEQLRFSLGGKSLAQVHPGKADNADDEEIEDLGEKVGTKGDTLFMVNSNFQIHPKSSVHYLYKSLVSKVDDKFIDRVWAPDWNGMVTVMKIETSGDTMTQEDQNGKKVERPVTYKVVEKVVSMGKGKGKAAAGGKDAGKDASGKDGGNDRATEEKAIQPILEAISSELDGTQVTMKALNSRVSKALQASKIDTKQHVSILALVKDDEWLKKNAKKYDMTVDTEERTVAFGTVAAAE